MTTDTRRRDAGFPRAPLPGRRTRAPGRARLFAGLLWGGLVLSASCGPNVPVDPVDMGNPAASSDAPVDVTVLPVLLVASITPGKPSAPTETIELRRDDEGTRLTVTRAPVDGTPESRSVLLPAEAIERLASSPLSGALASLSDETRPDAVDDFGLREVRARLDANADERTWRWERALVDDGPATTLFRELATVARERIPDVLLAYFPR